MRIRIVSMGRRLMLRFILIFRDNLVMDTLKDRG